MKSPGPVHYFQQRRDVEMPFPEEVGPAVLLERRSIFIESEAPSIHSLPLVALDQARYFLALAPCCGDKGMRLVQLLREIYLDQPQRLPAARLDRFLLLLGSGLLPRLTADFGRLEPAEAMHCA